jgi:putative tricarboxylic transport membrane protein
MLHNFFGGILTLVQDPFSIFLFFIALFGGLFFAALPGINMVTLCAIILPFTSYLSADQAIMMYGVIYVSGTYGGAVMAILFNIPGAPENAPTAFDGYPLTQQGKAGKAIGAAVMSSALGGIFSVILLMISAPILARWAIRSFGPPEIFSLIVLGLTVAASVGAKNIWKGWLSVLFGLMITTIGTDPAAGVHRYAFGSYFLLSGINFIPIILGFFAISEVFIQGERLATGIFKMPKIGIEFPTLKEFFELKITIIRSWIIGFFAGVLPGIGATLASFLSYNEAVRWSKHPEGFGKGALEGVVASESANNSAVGGAMIPVMALGLPGGAVTAMMISVFIIHGMEPGPLIIMQSKDLVWMVFVSMFLANFCIFFLGYLETKTVVNLLKIPFRFLGPIIILLATIGCYALRNSIFDIWVMFIAGILGYFMRRTGYSMAGLILGVILGNIGEAAYVKALQMLNYTWLGFFQRPISASLLIFAFITLFFQLFKSIKQLSKAHS